MDHRQRKILEAIIDVFLQNALPVGSKHLADREDFKLSSATIRNEMSLLEKEGYITQPHTSAGRIPTDRAYRLLVDQMKEEKKLMIQAMKDMERVRRQYELRKTKEKLYEIITLLASVTDNVSFATIPDRQGVFYIGIGNILKKPEFQADPTQTTKVIEVLENELQNFISELKLTDEGSIYIGEENLLPQFQSCGLLAIPYFYKGFKGVMGILGPTRMNYAYNMAALKSAVQMLVND